MQARPIVNVLGVGVSAINLDLALEAMAGALERKEKGYICVTGVHGVSEAQTDEGFRRILNRAFLCTPDGMPLVWAGRWQGRKEMGRVYGPDLMLAVLELSEKKGYRHFFYGGANGAARALREQLEKRFPKLQIAGTCEPPFRPLNAGGRGGVEEGDPGGASGRDVDRVEHAQTGEVHGGASGPTGCDVDGGGGSGV